jgi:hypothetical protein
MPQSSLVMWVGIAVALVLLALCGATTYATLRRPARTRIVHWPARRLLGVCVLAVLPWLVVWLRALRGVNNISVSVNGTGSLIGWLVVALIAFALLILLPLAAMLALLVWSAARIRR